MVAIITGALVSLLAALPPAVQHEPPEVGGAVTVSVEFLRCTLTVVSLACTPYMSSIAAGYWRVTVAGTTKFGQWPFSSTFSRGRVIGRMMNLTNSPDGIPVNGVWTSLDEPLLAVGKEVRRLRQNVQVGPTGNVIATLAPEPQTPRSGCSQGHAALTHKGRPGVFPRPSFQINALWCRTPS